MAQLQIKSLTKSFGDTRVIKGVDLLVEDRDFCVFLGPSGCGKSTLLRLIAGLEEATSGHITLDGADITDAPPARRNLAMVFQSYALYPHMTIRQNMSFSLDLAKAERKVIDEKVGRAARILQLEPLLDRKPAALSGGQRQRVAIGRAIVREPRIFLFDEPLSNLDAALRVQMRLELARLHMDLKATMIYVTHDQVEAMTLANKVVIFNAGNIEQIGPPEELYRRPVNKFVAAFLGMPQMSFIEATVQGGQVVLANGSPLPRPTGMPTLAEGTRVTLGLRPEHVSLSGPGVKATLEGRVDMIERLGSNAFAFLSVPDLGRVTVRCEGDVGHIEGTTASVQLNPERLHVFDAHGVALHHPTFS